MAFRVEHREQHGFDISSYTSHDNVINQAEENVVVKPLLNDITSNLLVPDNDDIRTNRTGPPPSTGTIIVPLPQPEQIPTGVVE